VTTGLLGIFAGLFLRHPRFTNVHKIAGLLGAGALMVMWGWLWGTQFPVIKKIWTSSYVLVAGGYSCALLGGFYGVVDVWQRRRWAQPFVWMGMNSITIYLVANFLGGFEQLAARMAGGDVKAFLDRSVARGFGELVVSLVGLGLAFWFVRFLYRRQIFLRL
jgi:predicted acyltransferase